MDAKSVTETFKAFTCIQCCPCPFMQVASLKVLAESYAFVEVRQDVSKLDIACK